MPSTALIHDYLLVMRGAERTFRAMASCWPDAPLYTLLFDPEGTEGCFAERSVRTSSLQRLGLRQGGFRPLLPFLPAAVEALPVAGHDLIVTSTSAFAHGVWPAPGAVHVAYCHSPFRYAWHERERTLAESSPYLRPALAVALERIRAWDVAASGRVTHYIANSEITRERIREFYGRDASVIHPPVAVERFRPGVPEDFLLVVAELVPHKRIDFALEAARLAGRPIKVVGGGPELKRLERDYGDGAEFLGRVSDADLVDLYARSLALVMPNVEEFGITAVEAQAAGRPVIAADAGGARETVVPGETGVLVSPGSVDSLAEAMRETDFEAFSPSRIRAHAARFSTEMFRERLRAEVDRLTGAATP